MKEFINGIRDGKGIIYYANGERYMGDYSNDKKVGKHVILDNNGNIFSEIHQ